MDLPGLTDTPPYPTLKFAQYRINQHYAIESTATLMMGVYYEIIYQNHKLAALYRRPA
jgi:hypothetical protein